MIEFRKAKQNEGDDIIDFINYVFSNNSNPHDFKKLNPRLYNSGYPFWDDHYIATEDGRIRATVAITDEVHHAAGTEVHVGHVGQVSVHPYHRGKGYMQQLLRMAIDDMIADGKDCSILGGQRQRYGYFGYEPANYRYIYEINRTNMRHVIGKNAPRVTLSAKNDIYTVHAGDREIGTIGGDHIALDDYTYAADTIEAYFRASRRDSFSPAIPLYEVPCAKALSAICENVRITNGCTMMRVFRFRKILTIGLKLRAAAGLCADGELTLRVGDETFGLRVCGKHAEDFDTAAAAYTLTQAEMGQLMLRLTAAYDDKRIPLGWFPITI